MCHAPKNTCQLFRRSLPLSNNQYEMVPSGGSSLLVLTTYVSIRRVMTLL